MTCITCCQEAAAQHWCDNGVDEGRQATSSFHTKQYLDNYPDLAEVRYITCMSTYIFLALDLIC